MKLLTFEIRKTPIEDIMHNNILLFTEFTVIIEYVERGQ